MRTPIFEGVDSTHGFKHRGEMFFDKSESQMYICDPAIPPIPPVPPEPPTPAFPTRNLALNYYYNNYQSYYVFFIAREDAVLTGLVRNWDVLDCDAEIIDGSEYVSLEANYAGGDTTSDKRTWCVRYKSNGKRILGTSSDTFTIRFSYNQEFLCDITKNVDGVGNYLIYDLSQFSPVLNTSRDIRYNVADDNNINRVFRLSKQAGTYVNGSGSVGDLNIDVSRSRWNEIIGYDPQSTYYTITLKTDGIWNSSGTHSNLDASFLNQFQSTYRKAGESASRECGVTLNGNDLLLEVWGEITQLLFLVLAPPYPYTIVDDKLYGVGTVTISIYED